MTQTCSECGAPISAKSDDPRETSIDQPRTVSDPPRMESGVKTLLMPDGRIMEVRGATDRCRPLQ